MTDEPNERTDLGATPGQPGERRSPQHRRDEVVDGTRVTNDDEAGSYTDVDLAPDEVAENEGAAGLDEKPEGEYTDIDNSGPDGNRP